MTKQPLYLPEDVALKEYRRLRSGRSPGGRERTDVNSALFTFWERYTAPFRVVRFQPEEDIKPHYVVFRVEGHGLEEQVWWLRGDHREIDAVRMSVMLRNQWIEAQWRAAASGGLDFALRHAMDRVRHLVHGTEGPQGQQGDPDQN